MNQIVVLKQMNKKRRRLFKLQFFVSVLALLVLCFCYLQKKKKKNEMEQISNLMNQAFTVETVYSAQKTKKEMENKEQSYFGKITIPKIGLEYSIFNECSEELLKILPCKFYGVNLGEKGNIAIAGHNYNDFRFFGNLDKLKKGDTIYLEEFLSGIKYQYIVYDKFKVEADDFNCLEAKRKYDLTLITCDNFNQKRLVIKASK